MAITLQGNGLSTFSNNITSTTGNLTLGDGNLVVADGHGIDFSAAETANADSSLLDDYETGEFDPFFASANAYNTNVKSAYTSQGGFYTKIGNVVNCTVYIESNSVGFTSGLSGDALAISGLPFTARNNAIDYGGGSVAFYRCTSGAFSNSAFYIWIQPNTTTIRVAIGADTQTSSITLATVNAVGDYFGLSFHYFTDA